MKQRMTIEELRLLKLPVTLVCDDGRYGSSNERIKVTAVGENTILYIDAYRNGEKIMPANRLRHYPSIKYNTYHGVDHSRIIDSTKITTNRIEAYKKISEAVDDWEEGKLILRYCKEKNHWVEVAQKYSRSKTEDTHVIFCSNEKYGRYIRNHETEFDFVYECIDNEGYYILCDSQGRKLLFGSDSKTKGPINITNLNRKTGRTFIFNKELWKIVPQENS